MVRTSRSSSATITGGKSLPGIEAGTPLTGVPSSSFRSNFRCDEDQRARFRLRVFVHRSQKVDVDALLLAQDAEAAQLPPLVGREVGGDLGLAPALRKPLDQVQVVRLQQ